MGGALGMGGGLGHLPPFHHSRLQGAEETSETDERGRERGKKVKERAKEVMPPSQLWDTCSQSPTKTASIIVTERTGVRIQGMN